MTRNALLITLVILLVVPMLIATGCSRSPDVALYPPPVTPANGSEIEAAVDGSGDIGDLPGERKRPASGNELIAAGILQTIYFEYDRSDIRPDQIEPLENNAEYLAENPDQSVSIEGHCDERGSVEYNFALGARRANAIRDFLISRGARAESLTVMSKGEEEPAVEGSGEEVWALNRRAEFKPTN